MNREVVGVGNVIPLSSARTTQRRSRGDHAGRSQQDDPIEASATADRDAVGAHRLVPAPGEALSHTPASRHARTQGTAGRAEDNMLEQLDRRERLRLVEFVCSFAWADLEIQPEERVFISRLIQRLELDEEENLQVQQWLDRPPGIDDLDPTSIPKEHRRIFVDAVEGLISADGEISDEERDSFEIFKQLLGA